MESEHNNQDTASTAKVFSINCSEEKGAARVPLQQAYVSEQCGLVGDSRGSVEKRHVCFLSIETIRKQAECPKAEKKDAVFGPGDFAENITTKGLDLAQLKIGDRLHIGTNATLEISKIGKKCHKYCALFQSGIDCIIPKETLFAAVVKDGTIAQNDAIEIIAYS